MLETLKNQAKLKPRKMILADGSSAATRAWVCLAFKRQASDQK